MKKYFISLLDSSHRWYTIFFLLFSVLLIIGSQLVGTTDNIPGLSMLLGGMVFLFYTFLHPWRKSSAYAKLAGVSFGLILLTFLAIFILSSLHKNQYLSEGIVMGFIGLICLPGIVTGVAGALFWANRGK
jgi:hypothetical protein